MSKTIFLMSSAIAVLAFSANVARADEGDENKDIVVTATGAPQERDTVGQAITVVDREMIERRQATSLADILSTTPGVTFSRTGGPGSLTALRIRGAEDRHTLVLIDGVRINDPTSTGGAFDFGNLTSLVVDRVEVLRGPNSVPWGSDAIGGVVNVTTAPISERLSARAQAEYGYKDSAKLSANISGASGPVSASLSGGYFSDDGVSAFKNGAERDGYRQYAVAGKIGIALGENAGLDFRAYYADSNRDLDGFPPPSFDFADTADYATTQELTAYAGVHADLFDGRLRNRLAFTYTNVDRDNFNPPLAAPSSLSRGKVQRIEYRGDADIVDGVRVVFGAEHVFSSLKDRFVRYSTTSDSGFAQLVVTPVERVTLTGGIRVDDYRTYGTEVTFGANAVWRATDELTLRASYAEGFKAPSLYQLYSFYGNVDLKPETAKSYQVGAEQRFMDGRLVLEATLFQRDLVDFVDFGYTLARPSGVYLNVGRARAQGVEAEIRMKPTDRLNFDINYTYTDSEDRATGQQLLRRPTDSVSASIDWEAIKEVVHIGATVQTIGDRFDSDYQTFSRTSLEGYTLTTVRASVALSEHLEVYGRVENLFDEKYEVVSGYGTVGRAAYIGVRAKL